jgi:hypothetical protein
LVEIIASDGVLRSERDQVIGFDDGVDLEESFPLQHASKPLVNDDMVTRIELSNSLAC